MPTWQDLSSARCGLSLFSYATCQPENIELEHACPIRTMRLDLATLSKTGPVLVWDLGRN